MTVPTVSLDETSPAGSQGISLGDNRIREFKTQVREVCANGGMKFDSSGQDADMGKFNQVKLLEQADLGTGATGKPLVGGQTVSGKPELVYVDEDDNDVQITSAGYLNGGALVDGSNDFQSSALKTALIDFLYPVGSIYTEITGTNPGTTFGVGTWSAFGAGRVPVGYDSGDTDFDTAEETGGSKTTSHTHTIDKTNTYTLSNNNNSTNDGRLAIKHNGSIGDYTDDSINQDITTEADSTSVVQPYIVVHMWKRTA